MLMPDHVLPQTLQNVQHCEEVVLQVYHQGEACTAVLEVAQGKATDMGKLNPKRNNDEEQGEQTVDDVVK